MNNWIGIEVEDGALSMAQRMGGKAILTAERLPENLIRGNRIVSPQVLASLLKETVKKYRFQGSGCALVLPAFSTTFRTLTVPPMDEKQLKLNLPYEFRDYVGTDSIGYSFDYAVDEIVRGEDGTPTEMKLMAAAARRETVNEYADLLRRAGLRLKTALPREMAYVNLIRAWEARGNAPREYCAAEIGFSTTHIYMAEGGRLTATKDVDLGCRQVDEAIADTLNTDPYLAAVYRESNYKDVLSSEACRAVYERLALEIMKTVNFYRYENRASELDRILFFGPGAAIGALTDTVLKYVEFQRLPADELLPEDCTGSPAAALCAAVAGASLREGETA